MACLLADLSSCCEKTRKAAAKKLGGLDLACHPEIECALAHALCSDCAACVRMAAAHALKRLDACAPCTVAAFQKARCDRNLLVRLSAKFGPKSCGCNTCNSCGTCSDGSIGAPIHAPGHAGVHVQKPFVYKGNRYEPVLRDVRHLPPSRTLPGDDFGRRETLPITPARESGLFLIPVNR